MEIWSSYSAWFGRSFFGLPLQTSGKFHCCTIFSTYLTLLSPPPTVRKAFQPKKVYFSGVSARHSLTKKWTFKTSHWAGQMDLLCKCYACVLRSYANRCYYRCALIHCHRPDLLDYDKLDKVCVPISQHSLSNNTFAIVRPSHKYPACIWCSSRTSWDSGTLVLYLFTVKILMLLSVTAIAWSRRSVRLETRWA